VRGWRRPGPGYDGPVTTNEPGERRRQLDQPPGDRFRPPPAVEPGGTGATVPWPLIAVVLGGALAYTILGGILTVTAGLVVLAVFIGWFVGKLVSPPARAALVGAIAVVVGLLGIWLFGRVEGGVLDPIAYFDAVQGWPLVAAQLVGGAGMAAAASR
jgi:hypothetical protein